VSQQTEEREPLQMVTPSHLGRPDVEMNVIGWLIFFGLLVVILPVLPFLAVLGLAGKLRDALS